MPRSPHRAGRCPVVDRCAAVGVGTLVVRARRYYDTGWTTLDGGDFLSHTEHYILLLARRYYDTGWTTPDGGDFHRFTCAALSGAVSTALTALSWICVAYVDVGRCLLVSPLKFGRYGADLTFLLYIYCTSFGLQASRPRPMGSSGSSRTSASARS